MYISSFQKNAYAITKYYRLKLSNIVRKRRKFVAKTSWRFEFVDVNKSIEETEEEDAEYIAYAVIRAPKGNATAMYVPKGNADMIQAMFGYASADWPDLYEVLDTNTYYGLYISAPTADVSSYPNYYGGVYITSYGVLPAYHLTDKKDPNFEVDVVPGTEAGLLGTSESSYVTLPAINKPGEQAVFYIKNVPASIVRYTTYIDLVWGGLNYRYKLYKSEGLIRPTFCSDSAGNTARICGSFKLDTDTNTYTFQFGGTADDNISDTAVVSGWNTEADQTNYGIPFLDFTNTLYKANTAYNYQQYYGTDQTFEDWVKGDVAEGIRSAILNGGSVWVVANTTKLTYSEPLNTSLHLAYNVEEVTYALNVQPSPTENETTLTFSDFVYDKYIYDKKLYYTDSLPGKSDIATLADDDYEVLLYENKNGVDTLTVYQYSFDTDDDDNDVGWQDVTDDEETNRILAWDSLSGTDIDAVHHNIYRVSEGALTAMTTDATDDDFVLTENSVYNSFHAKAVEEDMEGELHTSGDLSGSLDEFGTDENGSDNYWEEMIVPDDSVCFAEMYVYKTFDDDLDSHGIYKYTRIEDDTNYTVSGQRYTNYVQQLSIAEGNTGGNCTDASESVQKKWATIIKNGLIEAAKPKYADVSLFYECSGIDSIKTYFPKIRATHYVSTSIAPKNIDSTLFANTNKISLSGRCRGFAQYCQELQYKDKNLRKKYYSCPVGAIAVMLLRIMENYYGGVAPSWLNDGSVGGQIEDCMLRTPIKARWDFTDDDTKVMDTKNLNPILMDAADGVLITSQKTTELNAGDWSKLGHSMSFDLCKKEIRDNVMKPQLMKKINDHWINKRQTQVDKILAKRTSSGDPIWSYAKADIAGVNNDYTRAQNVFNISVEVRVFPFSEKVKLSFTNLSQITTVSD